LTPQIDVDAILAAMTEKYKDEDVTTVDGVKLTLQMNGYI
jgi:phosphomannomutase